MLLLESDIAPLPVTQRDRSDYVDRMVERSPDERRVAEAVAALIADVKPVIAGLVMDDEGRLWVRRVVGNDEAALYDLFERDGTYVSSVRLGFEPAPYLPIRIRNGRIYALTLGSLDIPFIVRATVPQPVGR